MAGSMDELIAELQGEEVQLKGRLRGVENILKWLRAYHMPMIDANGLVLVLSRLIFTAKGKTNDPSSVYESEVYAEVYHTLYEKRKAS